MNSREQVKIEAASKNYLHTIEGVQNGLCDYDYGYRCIQNHLTTSLCNTLGFFTGMVSEEALKLPKSKRTKEHAYGMTKLAKDLIAIENPTIDKIKDIILGPNAKYNLTTSEENMILRSNNQDYSTISKLTKI